MGNLNIGAPTALLGCDTSRNKVSQPTEQHRERDKLRHQRQESSDHSAREALRNSTCRSQKRSQHLDIYRTRTSFALLACFATHLRLLQFRLQYRDHLPHPPILLPRPPPPPSPVLYDAHRLILLYRVRARLRRPYGTRLKPRESSSVSREPSQHTSVTSCITSSDSKRIFDQECPSSSHPYLRAPPRWVVAIPRSDVLRSTTPRLNRSALGTEWNTCSHVKLLLFGSQ